MSFDRDIIEQKCLRFPELLMFARMIYGNLKKQEYPDKILELLTDDFYGVLQGLTLA